ncbi:uncharacterized protein LOC113320120 [Papaver somniferum]|uniref:uncharacterized protein LOC113320120 n=1 Tax=Papaver somniferum TaxID=3469 RepID=UPI000E6F51D6|nr:uncharacterized protein LOC113320120 [Papaver somniferum]
MARISAYSAEKQSKYLVHDWSFRGIYQHGFRSCPDCRRFFYEILRKKALFFFSGKCGGEVCISFRSNFKVSMPWIKISLLVLPNQLKSFYFYFCNVYGWVGLEFINCKNNCTFTPLVPKVPKVFCQLKINLKQVNPICSLANSFFFSSKHYSLISLKLKFLSSTSQ